MKIKLIVNTDCAHDIHETTKYPRDWYKKKPTLKAGEILEVKEEWGNFYGLYYKCYNPKPGDYTSPYYDIPIENAEEINT